MWNMPSMGGIAVEVMVTVPTCQKPPMPVWLLTVPFVFCAGPIGPAGTSPEQDQLPSKNLSCAISGAGLGMAMPGFSADAAGFLAGAALGFSAGLPAAPCANVHGAAAS